MGFGTETYWFDMKVSKALVVWVADQFLRLNRHKLWVQPSSEHLSVE
jgi:hypothetical protein